MLFVSELLYKSIHAQIYLERCERTELPDRRQVPSVYGIQGGVLWHTNGCFMAYKPSLYGIQQAISVLFVWSYRWVLVCHTRGVCMPYRGCSGNPQVFPTLSGPKPNDLVPWHALARERGGKNCSEDICTVSPLDVTLWHAKLQNTAKASQWQNIK